MDEKQIKLFIATDISEDTEFTILTRKEISKISFFNIDNLPKTYHVLPFIEKLKRWIKLKIKKQIIINKSPMLVSINNNNNNNNNNNILKSPARNTVTSKTFTIGSSNTANDYNSNNRISNESINNLVNKIKSPSRNNIKNKINNNSNTASPFISNINSIIDLHNGTNINNQDENESVNNNQYQHQQSHQQQYHGNIFDQRNDDTFELSLSNSSHQKGWNVNEMFQTNAKLTGKCYDYTIVDLLYYQF
jgi:hypothetical protein